MASFGSDLWSSVFTGGTNRSLVLATYGSFAALQATLFALLVVTRSWHFVFLSLICAGLWAAIAWFINEVESMKKEEAAKQAEEDEKRLDEGEQDEVKKER